jgi:hypothetical protein
MSNVETSGAIMSIEIVKRSADDAFWLVGNSKNGQMAIVWHRAADEYCPRSRLYGTDPRSGVIQYSEFGGCNRADRDRAVQTVARWLPRSDALRRFGEIVSANPAYQFAEQLAAMDHALGVRPWQPPFTPAMFVAHLDPEQAAGDMNRLAAMIEDYAPADNGKHWIKRAEEIYRLAAGEGIESPAEADRYLVSSALLNEMREAGVIDPDDA